MSVNAISWSPEGSKIATRSNDSTMIVWNTGNGQKLFTLKGTKPSGWSPDGTKFLMAGYKNNGFVYSSSTGEVLISLDTLHPFNSTVQWSPDGSKFISTENNSAFIWSAVTGEKLFTLTGDGFSITGALWIRTAEKLPSPVIRP
ncbi:MAG: hypothetical protein IPL27_24135 [Lewinellaceae bacterium]|nr:hypothetical protein [Lewinellaceae bacterium]